MKKMITISILIFAVLFTGCQQTPTSQTEDSNASTLTNESESPSTANGQAYFTPETYPRVDGSTATIPLSEQFAAEAMGFELSEARTYIKHNTTHAAYVNLIEKEADIIFATYPSEQELQLAQDSGVELEIHPVVSEGFVFMTNEENPVSDLTAEQIVAIYSGEITNWSEVGGADVDILAYQREENSGSQSGMLALVMKDTPLVDPITELQIIGMEGLVEVISNYDNSESAIGYSYYYYVSNMVVRPGIRLIAVDGVTPSPETIKSGEYPYTTAYYAVIRKDEPDDSPARKLLDWTLSENGQAAAEEAGYVPVK